MKLSKIILGLFILTAIGLFIPKWLFAKAKSHLRNKQTYCS